MLTHSAAGEVGEKDAMPLKVAAAMKKEMPKMRSDESRRPCRTCQQASCAYPGDLPITIVVCHLLPIETRQIRSEADTNTSLILIPYTLLPATARPIRVSFLRAWDCPIAYKVSWRTSWCYSTIQEDCEQLNDSVEVEEGDDLFPPYCSVPVCRVRLAVTPRSKDPLL